MSREIDVAIVDYGAGNLHSLAKAIEMPGVVVRIEADAMRATDFRTSDLLVLPGVGAFGTAVASLDRARHAIRDAVSEGLPILGVCLGMQLLFEESAEGTGAGLGLIPGVVRRLRAARVPQIGWNTVTPALPVRDVETPALELAYYANSFVCQPDDRSCVTSWSTYGGDRFPASVTAGPNDNVVGVQYHPEKSSVAGVRALRQIVQRLCAARVR
jgi:glutamine amidotransferase